MEQIVEVQVKGVQLDGVLVEILEDGQIGLVPRREWSRDRSVREIPYPPTIGEQFTARLVHKEPGGLSILSRCQAVEPWQDVAQRYHVGQAVRGEVVNIRSIGAFIQLEPGLLALVYRSEMPLLRDQDPEDILAVGDYVEASITEVAPEGQRMLLSLTGRLRELASLSTEDYKTTQLRLLTNQLSTPAAEKSANPPNVHYRLAIPNPRNILVVDDDPAFLDELCRCLRERFEAQVNGFTSGREAIEAIKKGRIYDLAIIDVWLGSERGEEVAQEVLLLLPVIAILLSSSSVLDDYPLPQDIRDIPVVHKKAPYIADCIEDWTRGYLEYSPTDPSISQRETSFADQLGFAAFAHHSVDDALQQLLSRLREETKASQCVVIETDPITRSALILAADPPIDGKVREVYQEGLYHSVVRSVVEEESEYCHENVLDRSARLRNLFPDMDYRSVWGLPLMIPGLAVHHALFLLNKDRPQFTPQEIEHTRLVAKFVQVALERALLLELMRRYEQRYSLGQLLGSLVHEISNKLDSFRGVGTLLVALDRVKTAKKAFDRHRFIAEATDAAHDIDQTAQALETLVRSYQRIASDNMEAVDVNAIVHKVQEQLTTSAREARVRIEVDENPVLPPAYAIFPHLEQIVANLLLNAIQQINRQQLFIEHIAKEEGTNLLLPRRLVILQTRHNEANERRPIQIIVTDTGPGIHYAMQRQLFQLDLTTHRDQGLGLFVCRKLAEQMGGRIYLADSVMFIGSTFVVELPASAATRRA